MKVKFFDNINYQTFPETDDMVDIDENLLNQIGITKQYVNGKIVDYNIPAIKQQIRELKNKLFSTDYIVIKIAEAETEEQKQELRLKYAVQISQRIAWRDEIDKLEQQLNN